MADGDVDTNTVAERMKLDAQAAVEIARLGHLKALAQVRGEAMTAELAELRARFGNVQGSEFKGDVSPTGGAGGFEAGLLAAKAIEKAAACIIKALGTAKLPSPERRCIVFSGTQQATFGDLALFRMRCAAVLTAFERAALAMDDAVARRPSTADPPSSVTSAAVPEVAMAGTAVAVGAVGAALDVAAKLGSYFQSDYALAPVTVTSVDADLLATAVAMGLPGRVWIPARCPAPPQEAAGLLPPDLREARERAWRTRASVDEARRTATTDIAASNDAGGKPRIEADLARLADAAARHDVAEQAFGTLLEAMAAPDAGGVAMAARVAQQAVIAKGLQDGDIVVLLQLGGAAGTTYTKKNLWTFFGGMPFYVSGGAIASFLAYDLHGTVLAAGQFPVHSGFRRIGELIR